MIHNEPSNTTYFTSTKITTAHIINMLVKSMLKPNNFCDIIYKSRPHQLSTTYPHHHNTPTTPPPHPHYVK